MITKEEFFSFVKERTKNEEMAKTECAWISRQGGERGINKVVELVNAISAWKLRREQQQEFI